MIKFNNVDFKYKNKNILNSFNLEIQDGERICLFAPSGYGKTTILRLIMGLEKPNKGIISGLENKKIAVTFQEDRLIPHKTVYNNVALFGGEDGADDILNELGLSDAKNLYPAQLSGGMARRTAIARTLNAKGDIYIFDEPFNGIDRENTEKTAHSILKRTRDKTFIMVSHSKTEAQLLNCKIIDL